MVFVVHTTCYICEEDFVLLGCGTYFIEDNTIQYSIKVVVIIIYNNALHPLFTHDPCDYSRGLPVAKRKI